MIKSEAVDDFICKLQRYKNKVGNKDCKMSWSVMYVDLLLTRYFPTLCKDPASTLSVTDCKDISMAECCAANLRCSSNNVTA